MANKYTRKGQKPEETQVADKDEFVGFWERAWKVVEPQLRNIAIGIAAVIGVVVIGWIYTTIRDGRREDATEAFARVVRIHDAELLPEEKDKKPEAKAPEEGEVPRFPTAQARAEATIAELDKLDKEYGSSAVAKQARIYRAGVLFELGRFDEARKIAEEFAGEDSKNGAIAILARESAGLSLEAQGKLDEALAVYKDLEAKGGEFFRDRAIFDQARVLQRKGDAEGAKKLYKQLIEKSPMGPLKDEAENRLALLGG